MMIWRYFIVVPFSMNAPHSGNVSVLHTQSFPTGKTA
jgi:hypothetical protein